jgi:hypothetical protein
MRVGSIVECVSDNWFTPDPKVDKYPNPVKGTIYVVSDICFMRGKDVVQLAEMPEYAGYAAENFREVQFPPALTEQIEGALTAPNPDRMPETMPEPNIFIPA